jgi:hypothetical protein
MPEVTSHADNAFRVLNLILAWEVEMGGGGGGGIPSSDLKRLEEKAKQSLKEATAETSRHVFISFAFEDEDKVNLLRAQAANDKTQLEFDDFSLKDAINSKSEDYIKQKIRERIDRVSVTAVYLTPDSATSRWVEWEITESLKRGKGVIGVYQGDAPPAQLPSAFREHGLNTVKWAHQDLMQAIDTANKTRK